MSQDSRGKPGMRWCGLLCASPPIGKALTTHSTRTSREGNTFPLWSLCSPGWSQAQDFPASVLNQWIVVDATTPDKELAFSARLNEIGVSIGFFYLLTVPSWASLNPLSLRCAGYFGICWLYQTAACGKCSHGVEGSSHCLPLVGVCKTSSLVAQ